MYISADSGFFSPYHQCDLAVCFQTDQAINYMAACLFQFFRPHNIIFFIKTCFQLYQYGNLFTILCRLRKSCNDRRISADTVQSLLDRQYIRIFCSLTHEIHNRVKTHIWMM